jgi:hypothetical protein
MVLMAWADYMVTGDARSLEKYYEELKKKCLLPLARQDGLISTTTGLVTEDFLEGIHYHGRHFRDIVDWPQGTPANETVHRSDKGSVRIEGETDRYVFSDINTVVNAFHYRNLVLMSKIAGVLDKKDDTGWFTERAEKVKTSFNEKLLNDETGLYTDGEGVMHSSLHANIFPAAFGLAPRDNYDELREFFISKGMACSPYGAFYLLNALYEVGAQDYALELLTSESDRSWMNMIRSGATTTTEAWDIKYKNNMAWNHAWAASPVNIISRKVFGIEPLEPSFRKILIKPRPGGLERAEIKHPTIRGYIEGKIENQDDVFSLEVILPGNTLTDICLPRKFRKYSLSCNGETVEGEEQEDYVSIKNISPGKYSFIIRKNK